MNQTASMTTLTHPGMFITPTESTPMVLYTPTLPEALFHLRPLITMTTTLHVISTRMITLSSTRSCRIKTCMPMLGDDDYCIIYAVRVKAGIPRHRRRHGHPREDPRRHVRHARLKLFLWQAERHADILATILRRMSTRMSVSVSLSASWNASFKKLLTHKGRRSLWDRGTCPPSPIF